MATKIVLWRHGQTEYNVQHRVQGQVDIELNETGLVQAAAAAEYLVKLKPERIISSDLVRAKQTAKALAQRADLPVEVDSRLRERTFGTFEGLSAKDMRLRYPEEYEEWKKSGECLEAGIESRSVVGQRVKEAVLEGARQTPGVLVAVSHGSALTQGLASLLGLDPVAWQGIRGLDNCHWAVVIPSERPPHWRLAEHNSGTAVIPGSLPSMA